MTKKNGGDKIQIGNIMHMKESGKMNTEKEEFFSQQALAVLFSVTNKIQVEGDKYLEDLSVRQLMVMVAIIHLPDKEATNINIARMLGTTRQNTMQIISLLVQRGYLETTPNEYDKRALKINITAEGKQMLQECSGRLDSFLSEIFREFTTKEIETLWKLLKKMYRFDGAEHTGFEKNVNYLADDRKGEGCSHE